MSKIIVLIGAPGAGKGTQARLIQERLGLPQISTGDMLRDMAASNSPLADDIHATQSSGRLIPDEVVIRVVRERTAQEDCRNGYMLDGFPRTPAQARMLEELAKEQHKSIVAIVIDIPFEILEKRATGRRTCPICGEIYNIYFKPPKVDEMCDRHPGAKLIIRPDDTAEKIRIRLRTYEQETKPLIDYYANSGRLVRVNGLEPPEVIYNQIREVIVGEPGTVASEHLV